MQRNRVEIAIDRDLEERIRKRLPAACGLSELVEDLLMDWLDSVDEGRGSSGDDVRGAD